MNIINIIPDEVLVNSMLDGCEKAEEYNIATELFLYFKKLNVNLPQMAYSIMMKV